MPGTKETPKRSRSPRNWKPKFLEALAECGFAVKACQATGVARSVAYRARASDPEFAMEWDDAIETATETAEVELRRRAVDGIDKPIYHQGVKIDTVKDYSDGLLMFMLSSLRPDKYRQQRGGIEVTVNTPTIDPAVAEAARKAMLEVAPENPTHPRVFKVH
jgi:hypothetical protein